MHLDLNTRAMAGLTLQTQVFEQVRAMIVDGRLRAGDALPAIRELSRQLHIARNTVTLAYDRLAAEGFIETRRSVGTFVSSQMSEPAIGAGLAGIGSSAPNSHTDRVTLPGGPAVLAPAMASPDRNQLTVDFWVGRPDPQSFPLKLWTKLITDRLRNGGPALLEDCEPGGLHDLRKAIAEHLRPARGILADPSQIIIVGGCQDGLNLIARLLLRAGSPVILEQPCHQGAAYLFESLGANLMPVPVDSQGLDVAKLPSVRRALAVVTPSHQYPLGVTLSLERRMALLDWATANDGMIVEDDYDADLCYAGSPLTALHGLDRTGRVIYLGTFSKSLGAGLRLAYLIVPPTLVEAATRLKALMNNGQPWLEQAALADFMMSGRYERHLRKVRKIYLARRNALLTALAEHFGSGETTSHPAGMHLVWRIPDGLPGATEIETIARRKRIGVTTLQSGAAVHFAPDAGASRYLVFGFAGLSEREIERGISMLRAALGAKRAAVVR